MAKKNAKNFEEMSFEELFEDDDAVLDVEEVSEVQATYRVYSTGVPMLDTAIGQRDPLKGNMGIPARTIVEAYGPPQSGKTLLAEQLAKSVLLDDPENIVVIFYTEESDMDRWESIGVTKEMRKRIKTLNCFAGDEDSLDVAEKHLDRIKYAVRDPRVKLVIIDSLKGMGLNKQIYTDDGQIKSMSDPEKLGLRATVFGEFLRDFKMLNKWAILFCTNQISDQMTTDPRKMPPNQKYNKQTPVGRAIEFEAMLRIECRTNPIEEGEQISGKPYLIAWETQYRICKCKFRNRSYNRVAVDRFYFDDPVGFRKEEGYLTLAEWLSKKGYTDCVTKGGGGFYTICGQKIRGEAAAKALLRDNPEIFSQVESIVLSNADHIYEYGSKKKGSEEQSLEELF
jgi:RecA/RadA recombinase